MEWELRFGPDPAIDSSLLGSRPAQDFISDFGFHISLQRVDVKYEILRQIVKGLTLNIAFMSQ